MLNKKNILDISVIVPILNATDSIKLLTPSHRFDLEIQEDLVEEIARLVGYDNLPTIELKSSQQKFSKTDYSKVLELKKFLTNNNFQEVINYSFVDDDYRIGFRSQPFRTSRHRATGLRKVCCASKGHGFYGFGRGLPRCNESDTECARESKSFWAKDCLLGYGVVGSGAVGCDF